MIVRTTNYNNTSMMNNLTVQQNKLYDAYNKINNNEKFSNISENPIDATGVININMQLQKIEMYTKNIDNETAQINVLDITFETIVDKKQRRHDLTLQGT